MRSRLPEMFAVHTFFILHFFFEGGLFLRVQSARADLKDGDRTEQEKGNKEGKIEQLVTSTNHPSRKKNPPMVGVSLFPEKHKLAQRRFLMIRLKVLHDASPKKFS